MTERQASARRGGETCDPDEPRTLGNESGPKSALIGDVNQMKHLTAALLFSVLGVGGLAAQAPSTGAPAPATAPPEGTTVTATGCLRAGPQTGMFVLANAKWDVRSAEPSQTGHHGVPKDRPAANPPGTAGSGTPSAGETLRLAGATARLKLNEHVGHTVTVTGMLAAEDRIVTPGIVLPDTPNRKPDEGGKPPARVFNVRSVTMVSADCK
jgi:hypothetical protein